MTKSLKPNTMNCSPNISIALSLLALTAGVWFLYKTQKENLSILYKVAAWFIIIVTALNMACCGMRCMMQSCMMRQNCYGMEQCQMGMKDCRMGAAMCMKGGMKCDDDDECEMGSGKCCKEGKGKCEEEEGECKEGKMDCCKKGKEKCEMEMKKDSVVIKK